MKLNSDKKAVIRIRKAIKNSNGYCPCSLIRDKEHICPCKDMRENNICICGLYVKE